MAQYTYFGLIFFTAFFPLLYSFERQIYFRRFWKAVAIATVLVAVPFLIWDSIFTHLGVWSFNDKYHLNLLVAGLPFEEVMFFFAVPFACLFLHQVLKFYRIQLPPRLALMVAATVIGMLFAGILLAKSRLYPTVTAALLLPTISLSYRAKWFPAFCTTYLAHLIPFAIMNGVLTALPVVEYSATHTFNLRIGTIPIEDPFYSMLLLLWNTALFERISKAMQLRRGDA